MKKSTTATYVSTSVLLGMLVVLMIPSSAAGSPTELALFGMATISQQDVNGDTVFTQTVHNRLFDNGEDLLLDGVFKGLTEPADSVQIGAICIGAQIVSTNETDGAGTWNTANNAVSGSTTAKNCITDGTVTKSGQIATVGPLVFTANADGTSDHWLAGDTVTNIAVCAADTGNADIRDCQTSLFAVVSTSSVTLAAGETVTVTYTFSLVSDGT